MRRTFSQQTNGAERPGLLTLGWIFLRLGTIAFGGLGAALTLFQRELVDHRSWLSEKDVKDALAFTKPLPGSTVVQVVAFLGWRLRGWPGALVMSIAFVTPSAFLMIAAAAGSVALPEAIWVKGALDGLQVAVVGLLAAAMWRLSQSEANNRVLTLVLLASVVLGFLMNAVVIVIVAGLLGALFAGKAKNV